MKRSLLRNIAKYNMRKAGLKRFCKHSYIVTDGTASRVPSEFAQKWRSYIKEDE